MQGGTRKYSTQSNMDGMKVDTMPLYLILLYIVCGQLSMRNGYVELVDLQKIKNIRQKEKL